MAHKYYIHGRLLHESRKDCEILLLRNAGFFNKPDFVVLFTGSLVWYFLPLGFWRFTTWVIPLFVNRHRKTRFFFKYANYDIGVMISNIMTFVSHDKIIIACYLRVLDLLYASRRRSEIFIYRGFSASHWKLYSNHGYLVAGFFSGNVESSYVQMVQNYTELYWIKMEDMLRLNGRIAFQYLSCREKWNEIH